MSSNLNSYELSRAFTDWAFENPEKIKPIHYAIYFFAIEHCNRLGWKKNFGLPSQMVMEAIGVKNWRTYSNALKDLVDFGFIIMVETSRNQYSSNIVAIVKNTKAQSKALDKALSKHSQKHGTKQGQGTVSINKQETKNKEQLNKEQSSDSKNLNVFSSEVFNCFDSIKIHFPENVLPTTQSATDNWLDVIDKLNRIDGLTFEEIEIIVKWVRNDNFWKQNFLSITKLRKKNSEGIHYWKVFVNKIQAQNGQKQSTFEAIANWGNDYNPDWSDKAGN